MSEGALPPEAWEVVMSPASVLSSRLLRGPSPRGEQEVLGGGGRSSRRLGSGSNDRGCNSEPSQLQ